MRGDFISPWYRSLSENNSMSRAFRVRVLVENMNSNASQSQYFLYVFGEKPLATINTNLVVNSEGINYFVFTNPELQAMGIGYIVHWKVSNNIPTNNFQMPQSSNWPPDIPNPSTSGTPFWNALRSSARFVCFSSNALWLNIYSQPSFSQWYSNYGPENLKNIIETNYTPPCSIVYYDIPYPVYVGVRYVSIIDNLAITNGEKFDPKFTEIALTYSLIDIHPYPNSSANFSMIQYRDILKFNIRPWGTCTTPSLSEATQNFNMVFASAIPNPNNTTAQRDFNFTLRPRQWQMGQQLTGNCRHVRLHSQHQSCHRQPARVWHPVATSNRRASAFRRCPYPPE